MGIGQHTIYLEARAVHTRRLLRIHQPLLFQLYKNCLPIRRPGNINLLSWLLSPLALRLLLDIETIEAFLFKSYSRNTARHPTPSFAWSTSLVPETWRHLAPIILTSWLSARLWLKMSMLMDPAHTLGDVAYDICENTNESDGIFFN